VSTVGLFIFNDSHEWESLMRGFKAGTVSLALAVIAGGSVMAAANKVIPPATPEPVSVVDNGKGGYTFSNIDGYPFFTYDRDPKGKSTCDESCSGITWLPLWARKGAEPINEWVPIIRNDGGSQWSYKGQAVYFYNGDEDPVQMAKENGHFHPLLP
jgi:predicted lipoprotein with Yx(FWY)xxD motif